MQRFFLLQRNALIQPIARSLDSGLEFKLHWRRSTAYSFHSICSRASAWLKGEILFISLPHNTYASKRGVREPPYQAHFFAFFWAFGIFLLVPFFALLLGCFFSFLLVPAIK